MNCPSCQARIPVAHEGELLGQSVDEDVLLLCGACGRVAILHGAKLEVISREFIDSLAPDKVIDLMDNTLQLRHRSAGLEATIELLERAVRKDKEDRT